MNQQVLKQIDNYQYQYCQKHQQELSLICLNKSCTKHTICGVCQEQQHKQHQCTSLKSYLYDLVNQNKADNSQDYVRCTSSMSKFKFRFKNTIQSIRVSIDTWLKKAERQFNIYLENIRYKINQVHSYNDPSCIKEHLRKINDKSMNINQLVDNLVNLRFTSQNKYNKVEDYLDKKINSFNSLIKSYRIEQNLNHSIQNIENANDPFNRSNIINLIFQSSIYRWGQYRTQNIKINGLIATQTVSSSSGQRFALMDTDDYNPDVISYKIKISKLKGWIGVGICLQNIIVAAGYKFNYTQPFHGSYMISANGYCWSHSQPSYNSSAKSSSFQTNDIIDVIYDAYLGEIKFENTTQGNKFTLKVAKAPEGDLYVPCVNMCNPGDEVEILNDLV